VIVRLLVALGAENRENRFDWGKPCGAPLPPLCDCDRVSLGRLLLSTLDYSKHEQSYPGGRTSAI
jgi:hypothetical protein